MSEVKQIDQYHIWHPFAPLKGGWPVEEVVAAKGCYLELKDGRKLIDAIGSWWVNIHGHGNEQIAKAIYDQVLKLDHVIFSGFTHQAATDLTKRLLTILPKNQQRVFFSDDGSTAVEVGVKMGVQYFYNKGEKRTKIISIEGAYHGDTFGLMSISGNEGFYAPFKDYFFSVLQIPFPNGRNDDAVIQAFEQYVKTNDVAVFVYEPLVQGAAGMRIYSPETLSSLLKIAHQYGVICVADEVLTGFGRTGKHFASDYVSDQPDVVCMSKALTGGVMPMGLTSCSSKVLEAFDSDNPEHGLYHGHSYTGNPIGCAAGVASFDLYIQESCQANIQRISAAHKNAVERFKNNESVARVQSLGVFFALEVKVENSGYFSDLRKVLYDKFIDRGLLLRPLGNVIYVLPPYIITDQELTRIYDAIEEVLCEI